MYLFDNHHKIKEIKEKAVPKNQMLSVVKFQLKAFINLHIPLFVLFI